jgi:hypothetical protein
MSDPHSTMGFKKGKWSEFGWFGGPVLGAHGDFTNNMGECFSSTSQKRYEDYGCNLDIGS